MDQDLISKKELLELTDISYGQLYRWKRKNLIPEQWFIHKATFTGQETFFPRKQILARIDRIKNMKDGLSLDELADMFSPMPTDVVLTADQLVKRNIVSNTSKELFCRQMGQRERFTFTETLMICIVDKLLQTGEMSSEEGKHLLSILAEHLAKFAGKPCELVFIRKMGVSLFLLLGVPSELYLEPGVKQVVRLPLAPCVEELKLIMTREANRDDG